MLVGILSDSHGRLDTVRRALALLKDAGADYLIHCGDVGGTDVFDQLAGWRCSFVWGNSDWPDENLEAYIRTLGLALPGDVPLRLALDGKTLAVFHGHEPAFNATVRRLQVDYILHGHTHRRCDERSRSGRIINPGALHRAAPKTVATLDTRSDTLTFHAVS